MKYNFLLDVSKGYLLRGTTGFEEELEAWESTIEVANDSRLMKRLQEVRDRIAKST